MTNTTFLKQAIACNDCGFTTRDVALFNNHSCDIQEQGGTCEDFPCCGHEFGDCNGLKYGSDEAIKSDPHLLCDHEAGICEVEDEAAEAAWEAEQDAMETAHYEMLREQGIEL